MEAVGAVVMLLVHAAAFLLAISDSNSVLRLRADTGLPAADL